VSESKPRALPIGFGIEGFQGLMVAAAVRLGNERASCQEEKEIKRESDYSDAAL
jgi:hypothetical protein